jgi:hypothetical protein
MTISNYCVDPYVAHEKHSNYEIFTDEPAERGASYTCDWCDKFYPNWKEYKLHVRPCLMNFIGYYPPTDPIRLTDEK